MNAFVVNHRGYFCSLSVSESQPRWPWKFFAEIERVFDVGVVPPVMRDASDRVIIVSSGGFVGGDQPQPN